METFFAFTLAVFTFLFTRRLEKMLQVKILINSLFDIYANKSSLYEHDYKEASLILMKEIIELEKQTDEEYYIDQEVSKLKKLRLIYFNETPNDLFKEEVKKISFKKLNNGFVILAFLNLKF